MSKAYTDLDMNTNDINNVLNSTATTQHRANSHFDANGIDGITQTFGFTVLGVAHSFNFKGGILTFHDVKK